MHNENATDPPCHFGECLGTSLSPNCPCDYREEELNTHIPAFGASCPCAKCQGLDTAATLEVSGEAPFVGEENPTAPGLTATAGVAPNGRESVQGKDEQDHDFFAHLMESNTPPPGIGAHNRDWFGVE
jgi:hypothetical protein